MFVIGSEYPASIEIMMEQGLAGGLALELPAVPQPHSMTRAGLMLRHVLDKKPKASASKQQQEVSDTSK
jgi:hypothetical protein